jgi:hypothetical protein
MLRMPLLAATLTILASASTAFTLQGGFGAGGGRASGGPNAITGRVLDPSGKPVPDIFVTALAPIPSGGRPFSFVSARLHTITNERGEFRLEGLYLGQFYVVALPHNPVRGANNQLNRSGFGKTFFPNASNLSDAKMVTVTTSAVATTDITLVPADLSVISGTVIGSRGQPVPGGLVGIAHGDGLFGLDTRGVSIRPDGTFTAPALPPGTYFLKFYEGAWPPPRDVIPRVSGTKVIVAGADVTGVRVVPIAMVLARGRLVVSPADRPSLEPSTIQIAASPINFDGNPGPQRPGIVRDDLTFEFRTWPSAGRIRVTFQGREWPITAIRLNGVDVTDKPIDFIEGKELSGLEVELVKRPSRPATKSCDTARH